MENTCYCFRIWDYRQHWNWKAKNNLLLDHEQRFRQWTKTRPETMIVTCHGLNIFQCKKNRKKRYTCQVFNYSSTQTRMANKYFPRTKQTIRNSAHTLCEKSTSLYTTKTSPFCQCTTRVSDVLINAEGGTIDFCSSPLQMRGFINS